MALQLLPAVESDADRIGEIHMAAFGTNAMLLAQFPTPAIRIELEKCIAKKALDDIQDPKVSVLVVRFEDKVISFAKWTLPILESENYTEPSWTWPEGTDYDVLNEWVERVEGAQQKALGSEPCYRKCNILQYSHLFYLHVTYRVMARKRYLQSSRSQLHSHGSSV